MKAIKMDRVQIATYSCAGPMGALTTTSLPIISRITEKESKELQKLEDEHDKNIIQKKREIFKSLQPHIRQLLIDQRFALEAAVRCNTAGNEVNESKRLREFRYKNNEGPFGTRNRIHSISYPPSFGNFGLKELETLHCEACTEEMMEEHNVKNS